MARLRYNELAKARIKEQRNVVISEAIDKDNHLLGYSVAEQLVTYEDGKEVKLFLKSGLGILSDEGLLELKQAVDIACERLNLIPCSCDCEG